MSAPEPAPTPAQRRYGRCLGLFVGVLVFMPVLSCLLFPSPHAEVLRRVRGHDVAALQSAALAAAADPALQGAYGSFAQLFAPQDDTRALDSLPPALGALEPRAAVIGPEQVVLLWDAGTLGGSECGLVLAPADAGPRLEQDFGATALRALGPGAWSLVPLR